MRRLCSRRLGSFVQANAQRLLLLISLALLVLCAAINSVKLDADLSSWIQRTSRIDNELQEIDAAIGDGAGSNSLLILQTPKQHKPSSSNHNHRHHNQDNENILSIDSFMIHLEALAIATHVTIDLFDTSWSLRDICFSPTLPDYEGLLVNQMLDHLMPCVIKTPLDCFWEGSKLLGPEQDVRLSSIGPKLKWTSLNPLLMVEAKKRAHPHASFPHDALISWMKRVGIKSGYQERPCLDPTDPNCPVSAPNKLSNTIPNIGAELTGGCRGLATNKMHWKEEEIVGGIERNRSGHIVKASALQSTIQILAERDVYDYWRKTSKVQDINNWSTDKAKLVLDTWQKRFEDELAQFTRTSVASSPYKIHALTPRSMLEPIDNNTILDLTNFRLTAILMTIFACIMYPSFEVRDENSGKTDSNNDQDNEKSRIDTVKVSRFKLITMALITSLIVILTFVASLGLSSFMNLPFNMATTQILPPLALYYGFRQALMIANIYSKNFKHVLPGDLTTECLNEVIPVVMIESAALLVPLAVASILPVQATRVFIFQAITYTALASSTAILLVPALLITFLVHNSCETSDKSIIYITYTNHKPRECISPGLLSIKSKKSVKDLDSKVKPSIEEQIFLRLQEDLMNMRADAQQPTDINFSLRADGSKTSLKLTTSRGSFYNTASLTKNQAAIGESSNHYTDMQQVPSNLPDLIQPEMLHPTKSTGNTDLRQDFHDTIPDVENQDCQEEGRARTRQKFSVPIAGFWNILISKRYAQALICLLRLVLLALMMSQVPKVRFGLQLRDIINRGTADYDSFMIQEKYFPVYNIFAITKGDFDYPSNQRLLYEYQMRIEQVNGIVRDVDHQQQPKFWLVYFRDWLLELQEQFDVDRNKSAISNEGWTTDASDASKMAYKLLAQTGRADNPIDKNQVDTNRLVDRNGIINQRAFYYYLTAWVMNDAYTYSSSEANFKPEPKTWNENQEDLRIERARPLTYAQIPFLIKLPEDSNGLDSIIEIRSISQAFDQLGLQNFPTGIPFIFWDQFINLDLLFIVMLSMLFSVLFAIVGLFTADLNLSITITVPTLVTVLELYGLLGYLSFQFNTIVAVLLISSIGTIMIQTLYCITIFKEQKGDLVTRINQTMMLGSRVMITSLSLLFIAAYVFSNSKLDFMTKYSTVMFFLACANYLNAFVLTPILFALLGSDQRLNTEIVEAATNEKIDKNEKANNNVKCNTNVAKITPKKKSNYGRKKRNFPIYKSEISLSTISEEPQLASVSNNDDNYS